MIFLNGDFSCKCYNFTKQGETYTFLLEETPQLTEDSCYVKSEDEFPMNLLTLKIKDFKYKDALKNGEVVKFVVSNSSSNNDRVLLPLFLISEMINYKNFQKNVESILPKE